MKSNEELTALKGEIEAGNTYTAVSLKNEETVDNCNILMNTAN